MGFWRRLFNQHVKSSSLVSFEDSTTPNSNPQSLSAKERTKVQKQSDRNSGRDCMRLCARKFTPKLFSSASNGSMTLSSSSPFTPSEGQTPSYVQSINLRLISGTTGRGFIDASLREVIHTDYTSILHHRQNVVSFHTNHFRLGLLEIPRGRRQQFPWHEENI